MGVPGPTVAQTSDASGPAPGAGGLDGHAGIPAARNPPRTLQLLQTA